jgi:hypothetical protein
LIMARRPGRSAGDRFLALDIDVLMKENPDRLVKALGPKVFEIHRQLRGELHFVALELSECPDGAERAISRFARVLRAAPEIGRRLWFKAAERTLNIGVEAGENEHAFELVVGDGTVKILSELKSRLVFTVYPAKKPKGATAGRRSSSRRR